ncbi:MAG: flippase-like domain-containing protein [Deltaproteobacteria bacterium]|nr:flippase-like domain-containing protein [Deltaproteobacteria bacterium]
MSGRASGKDVQRAGEAGSQRASMRRGGAIVALALAAAYTAMFLVAGTEDLHAAWDRMEAHFLVLPLLATFFSYLTMSFSYEGIVRAAGARISSRDMLRITLVANTANYIFPTGGLSGFAFRLVFFTKRGMSAGTAVAISFTQTLLTNLMLVLFVVFGMVNLLLTGGIRGVSLVAAAVATGLLSAGFLLLVLMISIEGVRRRVVETGARLVDRILDRTGYHGRFAARAKHFFIHVEEGMALFAGRPGAMAIPSVWIFLDWLFMMGALWLGFYATGRQVSFSIVTIAFSVSSVAAFLSLVPAGAGVLEGALAGTLAGLGVPLGDSLLPIILYRFCYFIVPTVISFFLAHGAFSGVQPPEEVV